MSTDGFKVKNRLKFKTSAVASDEAGEVRYDSSGNLVLRDGSAEKTILDQDNSVTVTNKSIDSDNNTITNIVNADIKAAAAIDATKIADGTVTSTEFQYINSLTSNAQDQIDTKAADADLTAHIDDATDAHDASAISSVAAGNLSATDVQTALDELQTDIDTRALNSDLTTHTGASTGVHGVTGSVVGTTDTQTLSAKTLTAPVIDVASLTEQGSTPSTPSAGTKKFYAKTDGKVYTLDSGGNEIEIGAGGGGGGVLYINQDFETGVTDLVAYADTAQATPVDGTGGTANITVTAETGSPLIGTTSALITKDAANRQGEGVAIISETVDTAYSDKVHTVEFLWKPSATVVADALKLFVVHPTTGTVEALNFRNSLGEYTNSLPTDSTTTHRIVSELTPIDSTYRIVIHVAGTDTTAYTGLVDNIQCGPQRTFNAGIITEWESYTPTFTGFGTVTGIQMDWRRVGDTLQVRGRFTSGTATATEARMTLPNGLQPSIANIQVTGMFGYSASFDRTTYILSQPTVDYVVFSAQSTGALTGVQGSSLISSGETVSLFTEVPISGWDAGAAFSTTQVDQQTVKARYSGSFTAAVPGTATILNYSTQVYDTHNAVSTGASWAFTAPSAGYYRVNANVAFGTTATASRYDLMIYINGSQNKRDFFSEALAAIFTQSVSGTVFLNKGDTVDIRHAESVDNATYNSETVYIEIESLPDFSVFGTFPEKNLVQTKLLSSNINTDTTMSDLTFSNLTIGKWYTLTGQAAFNTSNTSSTLSMQVTHNSTVIAQPAHKPDSGSTNARFGFSVTFKAEATSLTFVSAGTASTANVITGTNSRAGTWAQLEERNDLRETSKF